MNNQNKQWIFVGFLIVLTFFLVSRVGAAEIQPINPNIPGTNPTGQAEPNPVGIIGNLYQFALMIGGVLAFVMIIYAAIRHSLFAGNPSQQSESKAIMKDALTGLLLLMGAFIILNFLNPKLTTLQIKSLDKVTTTPPVATTGSNVKACGGTNDGYCFEGKCIKVSDTPLSYACYGGETKDGYGCIRAGTQSETVCAADGTLGTCTGLIGNGTCKQGSCYKVTQCATAQGSP